MQSSLGPLKKIFLFIKTPGIVGLVAVSLGLRNGEMKPFSPLVTFVISCSVQSRKALALMIT